MDNKAAYRAADGAPYRAVLERAFVHALAHLKNLDRAPVTATATLPELRGRLGKPLPDDGLPAPQVIDELAADVAGGILGSAGGRFFGWVIGGTTPGSLAADWLTAAWDQNAGLYAAGPAEAVIEEVCGAWLKDLLGLPAGASFALVTGSQMAHVVGLAAGRHALLARRGWDVESQGLAGAPPIRVLSSSERHGTVERALRLLGLGTACVSDLPADDAGRLQLEQALEPVPAQVAAGITDFAVTLPLPKGVEAATEVLAGVVSAFRAATRQA